MINQVDFWNKRAKLKNPGSDDWVAKELEIFAIMKYIKPNSTIIEFGCGDGSTLKRICKEKKCSGVGIDLSPEMIKKALKNNTGRTEFYVDNLSSGPTFKTIKFDYAITQRCIINIKREKQKQAIENVLNNVKYGGYYIACENFEAGLNQTNLLRKMFGLKPMKPPEHNNYLKEIPGVSSARCYDVENVLSLYHLISRVFVAKTAEDKKKMPRYNDPMNLIAMNLIKAGCNVGNFGPNKIVVWKKT